MSSFSLANRMIRLTINDSNKKVDGKMRIEVKRIIQNSTTGYLVSHWAKTGKERKYNLKYKLTGRLRLSTFFIQPCQK